MYHCPKRGRGILVKAFQAVRVAFNKISTYERVFQNCYTAIHPDRDFYIADSTGTLP